MAKIIRNGRHTINIKRLHGNGGLKERTKSQWTKNKAMEEGARRN